MRLIDRLARAAVEHGLMRGGTALIETTGRKSGEPRVTPITNGLDGDVFWIVTEHGQRANYVRNIEAEPRVRVKAGRSWRPGPRTSSTRTRRRASSGSWRSIAAPARTRGSSGAPERSTS